MSALFLIAAASCAMTGNRLGAVGLIVAMVCFLALRREWRREGKW